jgi:type IV pilus assembly protein PilW
MRYFAENRAEGFTLVELLIAMTLGLIVLTSLASAFVSQHKAFDVQEQVAEMVQGARAAMDMINSELKMAGYDPTDVGIVGVPYSATQLEIRGDLNSDGETDGTASNDDTNEEIIYTYDSANKQIDRNTGGGAQPFAENIQSFTFTYWKDKDDDGDGQIDEVVLASDEADIRQIDITITSRTSKPDPDYGSNGGYRTYTLSSYVTPPNLGF